MQHSAFLILYTAAGQNQWYYFGVGAPPILVYSSGDWDVHWGYGDVDPWPHGSALTTIFIPIGFDYSAAARPGGSSDPPGGQPLL